ncbi:hypothetical protein [Actinophytocola oryzae]|uniref:Uncharacterized protein n=1 Tax=Actinophytocola oryzae TaxID=502181 RepID=A0A4R7V8Y5_9PSEU|nr:hypothetical protein [Actinophytocola oryzae]TDV45372.1 hypothetical protein CLV71_11237 [Actinophytocola oryzae]
MRVLLALAGLVMLGYGGVLAWEFGSSRTINAVEGLAWFAGGPIVHDGLVAPVVGIVGLGIARVVARPWRTPVAVGVVLSAVLTLLAVPLLWRPFYVATNPGLHDRDYGTGLAIALAVVWVGVVVSGLAQRRWSRLALGRDQSSS